ncbi:MAG: gliding motility-associated C-terminal domain-containing protein [Sphingobacteriales bacterium]
MSGQRVIKLSRDFDDGYMWILTSNNGLYRLNTLTKQLDDYTVQFSSLSNYQIFDIAGINPNMVTIAIKNSDTALMVNYKNGQINYLPALNNYNFHGNVRAIDASSSATEGTFGFVDRPALLIATDKGFYRYSYNSGIITWNGELPSQIYSATYRNQMFLDRDNLDTTGVNLIPVLSTMMGAGPYYNAVLRTGPPFGDTIITAYPTENQLPKPQYFTPDIFWGNANGMFQAKGRNARPFLSPYKHYLDNIKVNKITDIYGLAAFGNSQAKENLLVGTDKGLYYSNSFLHAGLDTTLDNITLFHYDALGNIPINFIEVNSAAYLAQYLVEPICEDGIWVATNDGFYLIKPDYKPYLDTSRVNAIGFKDPAADTLSKHICGGDSVIVQTNVDISANSIQWFKDGAPLNNESNTSLSIKATGSYYAFLYNPCEGTHVETNHVNVTVTSGPVFSFNYPGKIQRCNNVPDTLKTDLNPGYRYRWYTNGVLNGDTTSQFIVKQSGKYKVELSACTNSWVPSKEIEVDLITLPVPSVTMDKVIYCAGDTAALTVNVPRDASYNINWYRDGAIVPQFKNQTTIKTSAAGNYNVVLASTISNCTQASLTRQLAFTPSPMFSFNYPDKLTYCDGTPVILQATQNSAYRYRWYKDNVLTGDTSAALSITNTGSYKVEASACAGSWVPSKAVQVDFIKVPTPVIKSDKPAYCIGDNATLSVNIPLDTAYTINWYRDNSLMASDQNLTSITTINPGNYSVIVTSNQLNCSQSSIVHALLFNAPPTVAIEKIVKTTLCDGQTVDLKVSFTGGTVQWSTGETSSQIGVTASGTYKATVTSQAGCLADTSINIQFLPNPTLNVKDTSLCTFTRQTIELTAPPGFAAYSWNNGMATGQTYSVNLPQTVSLTVTDSNGCTATQQIIVASQCPDVHIPNTFTPNGDGMNDLWVVGGLENDATVSVRVYNRYGSLLYESKGYCPAWDGTYQGSKLPPGVYYYTISAKNNKQKFSGPVTIIY